MQSNVKRRQVGFPETLGKYVHAMVYICIKLTSKFKLLEFLFLIVKISIVMKKKLLCIVIVLYFRKIKQRTLNWTTT